MVSIQRSVPLVQSDTHHSSSGHPSDSSTEALMSSGLINGSRTGGGSQLRCACLNHEECTCVDRREEEREEEEEEGGKLGKQGASEKDSEWASSGATLLEGCHVSHEDSDSTTGERDTVPCESTATDTMPECSLLEPLDFIESNILRDDRACVLFPVPAAPRGQQSLPSSSSSSLPQAHGSTTCGSRVGGVAGVGGSGTVVNGSQAAAASWGLSPVHRVEGRGAAKRGKGTRVAPKERQRSQPSSLPRPSKPKGMRPSPATRKRRCSGRPLLRAPLSNASEGDMEQADEMGEGLDEGFEDGAEELRKRKRKQQAGVHMLLPTMASGSPTSSPSTTPISSRRRISGRKARSKTRPKKTGTKQPALASADVSTQETTTPGPGSSDTTTDEGHSLEEGHTDATGEDLALAYENVVLEEDCQSEEVLSSHSPPQSNSLQAETNGFGGDILEELYENTQFLEESGTNEESEELQVQGRSVGGSSVSAVTPPVALPRSNVRIASRGSYSTSDTDLLAPSVGHTGQYQHHPPRGLMESDLSTAPFSSETSDVETSGNERTQSEKGSSSSILGIARERHAPLGASNIPPSPETSHQKIRGTNSWSSGDENKRKGEAAAKASPATRRHPVSPAPTSYASRFGLGHTSSSPSLQPAVAVTGSQSGSHSQSSSHGSQSGSQSSSHGSPSPHPRVKPKPPVAVKPTVVRGEHKLRQTKTVQNLHPPHNRQGTDSTDGWLGSKSPQALRSRSEASLVNPLPSTESHHVAESTRRASGSSSAVTDAGVQRAAPTYSPRAAVRQLSLAQDKGQDPRTKGSKPTVPAKPKKLISDSQLAQNTKRQLSLTTASPDAPRTPSPLPRSPRTLSSDSKLPPPAKKSPTQPPTESSPPSKLPVSDVQLTKSPKMSPTLSQRTRDAPVPGEKESGTGNSSAAYAKLSTVDIKELSPSSVPIPLPKKRAAGLSSDCKPVVPPKKQSYSKLLVGSNGKDPTLLQDAAVKPALVAAASTSEAAVQSDISSGNSPSPHPCAAGKKTPASTPPLHSPVVAPRQRRAPPRGDNNGDSSSRDLGPDARILAVLRQTGVQLENPKYESPPTSRKSTMNRQRLTHVEVLIPSSEGGTPIPVADLLPAAECLSGSPPSTMGNLDAAAAVIEGLSSPTNSLENLSLHQEDCSGRSTNLGDSDGSSNKSLGSPVTKEESGVLEVKVPSQSTEENELRKCNVVQQVPDTVQQVPAWGQDEEDHPGNSDFGLGLGPRSNTTSGHLILTRKARHLDGADLERSSSFSNATSSSGSHSKSSKKVAPPKPPKNYMKEELLRRGAFTPPPPSSLTHRRGTDSIISRFHLDELPPPLPKAPIPKKKNRLSTVGSCSSSSSSSSNANANIISRTNSPSTKSVGTCSSPPQADEVSGESEPLYDSVKDEEEQEDDAASSRVVSSSRLERASHSLDSEATTSTRLGFSRLRRSLSARHRHRTEPAVQVSGNSLEDINKVPSAEESEAFSVAKYSLLGRSEDSSSDDSELTFGALGSLPSPPVSRYITNTFKKRRGDRADRALSAIYAAQVEPDDEPLYQYINTAEFLSSRLTSTATSFSTSMSSSSQLDIARRLSQKRLWCEQPEVINSGILKTMSDDEKKLQEALFEVITSESTYLRSLDVLIEHFMDDPGMSPALPEGRRVLTKRQHHVIFSNIKEVRETSGRFLEKLHGKRKEGVVTTNISDVLTEFSNMDCYIPYCTNQIYQSRELQQCIDNNPMFREHLRKLEAHRRCQNLTLQSFLLLPMQRITRQPLLMLAILNRTPVDHPDHTIVESTLRNVQNLVTACNDGARKMERTEQLHEIHQKLDFGKLKPFPLVSVSRQLEKKGMLVRLKTEQKRFAKYTYRVKRKSLFVFSFTDYIIITKMKKSPRGDFIYQVVDHCSRAFVELEDLEAHPRAILPPKQSFGEQSTVALATWAVTNTATKHAFLLIFLRNALQKSEKYILAAQNSSDKTRWMEAISRPEHHKEEEKIYQHWDCPQVQAIYDYKANQPDELSLVRGDIVKVYRKMADGWYEGERLRDLTWGWFPSNFAVEIESEHTRARNLRETHKLLSIPFNNPEEFSARLLAAS